MAEVIGIAILGSLGTSAAVATGVGIAGVSLATIVGTTALLGGTFALSALTTPDTKTKVAAQQFASRQPLPPRRRVYGNTKLSGPYIAFDSTAGSFFTGTYLCEGPIGSILEFWLDDTKANIAPGALSGNSGVLPWLNAVLLEARLGTDDQTANSQLLALPYWTPNHRLAGCAYIAMRATAPAEKNFKKIFPSGTWPTTRAVIAGSRVRNPQDGGQTADPATWQFSDNATLCIRDLITHPRWGMKVPASLIDAGSFLTMASLCSEALTDKYGQTRARYTVGGAYDLTEDPADALQGMLDACDGRLYLTPDGKIGISGGRYVAPDVTLGHEAAVSIGSLEIGSGKRATFNRLKISYVSPFHDWQTVEGDPWEDLDGQAEAGEILEADFSRPWVQWHNQVRRLAKIYTAKQNPQYRITGLVTGRAGLPALYEDVIRLQLPRYGIDAVFTVERAVAAGDGSICTFDLVSLDPAAYEFDMEGDEGTAPPLANAEAEDGAPEPPDDLLAITEARSVSGNISAVFLRLTSDLPTREDLSLIGRYRAVGATDWIDMAPEGDARNSVISSVLADGQEYEAQGSIASYGRSAQSPWTATDPATITAIADATPTGPVTGFVANGGSGQFSYAFATPNVENFALARAYANSINDFESADVLHIFNGAAGQAFDRTENAIAPGTYYVWIAAFNRSGFTETGSRVGPIVVTVT